MSKIKLIFPVLVILATGTLHAEGMDTLQVVDMEEIIVIATPKETQKLREQPTSVTLLSQQAMQAAQINTVKGLSAVIPNLFIPDYGSRLTTAAYIRGIGSRINTPSVGLYVDNIPYIDKSAFDFNYSDIERVDVLRGPQGTLYGRNAMDGLIKVHTKSPFTYQGTDLRIGAATHQAYNASVTHYHRISECFAFSAGGFYDYQGGFFRNAYLDIRADKSLSGGGRLRSIWLPADNWKIDFSLSYKYSDQGAYPYRYLGSVNPDEQDESLKSYISKIATNEAGKYRRNLLNAGLNIEYQTQAFTLSTVTGYQFLKDRMFMDQDFTPANLFNIEQRQRMHALSEEIILKSKAGKRWQWITGAFGFYQSMHTDGPVNFHREGITQVIESNVNEVFDGLTAISPTIPLMHLDLHNESLRIGGSFDTPALSGALFHQSTLNQLFGVEGLSATVGLRLDYEKLWMDYLSASAPTDFTFTMTAGQSSPRPIIITNADPLEAEAHYDGKESTDYVQLLPKFALQYAWDKDNNVYLTAARGYRSGGYNIQMFSDLVTARLRNAMMDAIAADPNFSTYEAMIAQMKSGEADVKDATCYCPEYTWNYEAGAHLNLCDGRLAVDLAVFYMDMRDQQLSRFSEQGLGRVTVNAGKSRSMGTEATLRAVLTEALSLNVAYGYTYSTFTDYVTNTEDADGDLTEINYNGHYVPFVPKHTLNIGGSYLLELPAARCIDAIRIDVNHAAAGRIYWTEENTTSQPFYGTLNARLSLLKGNKQISLWVRNLFDKDYTAFYFENLGNAFAQQGRPIQAGIELRCCF